jgi:hypothetical protein
MENRTKGVYKAVPTSLMGLSPRAASPRVESDHLTTFPTIGLGRTPILVLFFWLVEAVRRVLREDRQRRTQRGG